MLGSGSKKKDDGSHMIIYSNYQEYLRDLHKWGKTLMKDPEAAQCIALSLDEKTHLSLKAGIFLPLPYLEEVFALNSLERFLVRLALLPELDTSFEMDFSAIYKDDKRRLLSPELAGKLFLHSGNAPIEFNECWGSDGILRRYFFAVTELRGRSNMANHWKLNNRIIEFALHEKIDNPVLAAISYVWEPGLEDEDYEKLDKMNSDQLTIMNNFFQQAEQKGITNLAFILSGPSGSGQEKLIAAFCHSLGRALLFIDASKLLDNGRVCTNMLIEILRESIIRQSILCFTEWDYLNHHPDGERVAAAYLEEAWTVGNLVFAIGVEPIKYNTRTLSGRVIKLNLHMPDEHERLQIWRHMSKGLKLSKEISLEDLAGKFVFSAGQIGAALKEAESSAWGKGIELIEPKCLLESCYKLIHHDLAATKAIKVPAIFVWDDLILPTQSKELLRLACSQIQCRYLVYHQWGFGAKLPYGRGISLLFCGPPGTGKTMAAQVMANELGMELYKVDLSAVVSKYIGETEKNLAEVFREAQKSQAILFFDEADVLFSKRTEVKDAHDRYSNMEAAYMLQKIEEYEGVSVLATNFLQNFDEAFKRRLKFIIDFPFPNAEYRLQLWNTVFPAAAPLGDDIDREFLARSFEFSGSSIKNIAINASFIAADRGKAINMEEILMALRYETIKSGQVLSKEDFGEYQMLYK